MRHPEPTPKMFDDTWKALHRLAKEGVPPDLIIEVLADLLFRERSDLTLRMSQEFDRIRGKNVMGASEAKDYGLLIKDLHFLENELKKVLKKYRL